MRPDLFAIYAFNHEVAKTWETVSQPLSGQIRLQWWRDTIDGIYAGTVREHPVAEAVARAAKAHDLPPALFDDIIDAHERDLESEPFADLAAMEAYGDATAGNVMRLALRVLGAGPAFDDAASNAGTAYALVGLLRNVPFAASRERSLVPRGVAIASIAAPALEHLRRVPRVPRKFLPALLPAALVLRYAHAFLRTGFEPLRDSAEIAPHVRQWIMLKAMARGRL